MIGWRRFAVPGAGHRRDGLPARARCSGLRDGPVHPASPFGERLTGSVTTRLLRREFYATDGRTTCSGLFHPSGAGLPASVGANCSNGQRGTGSADGTSSFAVRNAEDGRRLRHVPVRRGDPGRVTARGIGALPPERTDADAASRPRGTGVRRGVGPIRRGGPVGRVGPGAVRDERVAIRGRVPALAPAQAGPARVSVPDGGVAARAGAERAAGARPAEVAAGPGPAPVGSARVRPRTCGPKKRAPTSFAPPSRPS